ncbi:MAG TPA: hypothetical protein VHZ78_08320 [Rhizomicrobium sp.]|jgi:hypothetical protein|nr:hypothetical protein [Rhizomicrobium sp.]
MSGAPLSFDDPDWTTMKGGYRIVYDPRAALRRLETDDNPEPAWLELWNELHHQGDVGEASYAAVPHLVRIHRARGVPDWNTYALVQCIDEARRASSRNPALPPHLQPAYESAWEQLGTLGLSELREATEPTLVRSIVGVLAVWKRQFALGALAFNHTEDELRQVLEDAANL